MSRNGKIFIGCVVLAIFGMLWLGAGGDEPDGTNRGVRAVDQAQSVVNSITGAVGSTSYAEASASPAPSSPWAPWTLVLFGLSVVAAFKYLPRLKLGQRSGKFLALLILGLVVFALWQTYGAHILDLNVVQGLEGE